jgi:hypothetical protein
MSEDQNIPAAPAPQPAPQFKIGDAREAFENFVDTVDMSDETGSIEMVVKEQAPAPEPEQQQPLADTPPQPPAAPDTPSVDWEDRYKNLQSAFTKATQSNKDLEARLAKLEGYADGKRDSGLETTQDGPEPVDPYELFSDPSKTQAYIGGIVQETIAGALTDSLPPEIQEVIAEKKVDREVQSVIQENPDFYDYVPAMQEIYSKVQTDLPVAEAFALAKELYEATPSTQTTPQPPQPAENHPATPVVPETPVAAPSPQELAARAAQLQTAQGSDVDGGFVEERVIKSAKDAMMVALEDTYGNG